jgi:hypothetical protein
LEVANLRIVPALQVDTASLKLRDLEPRGQDTVEFACWSETRPSFRLKARKESLEANIDVALEPLSAEQCGALGRTQKARVLSGYRGHITVHERRDGKALPLGALQQKVVLDGPEGTEPITLTLHGRVRGEVRILPDGDDVIALKEFLTARGTERKVVLGTEDEKVDLKLDSFTPANIAVKLEPAKSTDGNKRWELTIQVPPRAVVGSLPSDAAVYLLVQGEVTRKLKLPLSGQGTQ